MYWFIIGPSFLEGGPIMCWSCPSVCLSDCLSVPCLRLEGKRKGLRIANLVGRVPGTPAPREPISRSRGQRSRSRRLIAQFAKNPHNFAAGWPVNFIFGRCHKDPSPPCPGWPRYHGNGRSHRLSVRLSLTVLHLERKRNGLRRPNTVGRVSIAFAWLLTELDLGFVPSTVGTNRPRKRQNSTHVLNCKDGPIAGGPSMAAPFCLFIRLPIMIIIILLYGLLTYWCTVWYCSNAQSSNMPSCGQRLCLRRYNVRLSRCHRLPLSHSLCRRSTKPTRHRYHTPHHRPIAARWLVTQSAQTHDDWSRLCRPGWENCVAVSRVGS